MITLENPAATAATSPAGQECALAPLLLAFASDPAVRWMYPDPHHYRTFFPLFVRAFGGRAFAHGTAQCLAGNVGAALWLPPGVAPDDDALIPLIEETVAPALLGEVFAIFEQMGAQHPAGPHWYLPLIGIDPRHQGRGLGSRLLASTLAVCDREGLPAYLEASNPRNVPFYERHGFTVRSEIQAGTSPTIFPMVRDPR